MVIQNVSRTIKRKFLLRYLYLVLTLLAGTALAHAENAAFDLSGPRVEIKVTRAGKPLPISEVPNLQPGDRLWIHPDFPKDQSARYLLVVSFLRGSTNPPPENWFTRAETWKREVQQEGIVVTVPADAQQHRMPRGAFLKKPAHTARKRLRSR